MSMPPSDPSKAHSRREPSTTAAPASIRAAVILMYVGAALQLLILIFSWLTRDQIRDQLAGDQSVSDATIGLLVVISVLAIAMWIWMALTNGRGLGWARIVATVLAGLNVAFTLFLLVQSVGLGVVMQLVAIGLAATIVFLLHRPDSSAYYTAMSEPPRR